MEYNSNINPDKENYENSCNRNVLNSNSISYTEENFLKEILNDYNNQSFENMEKLCIEFIAQFPNSPNPSNFLGLCYYELNKLEEAIKCYNKSLSIKENEATLCNLGLLYIKKQDYKLAHETYEKAYQINPNSVQIINNLSNTNEILGDTSKSYQLRKKVLQIDEFNTDALTRLHKMKLATNDDKLLCLKNLEKLNLKYPTNIHILEHLSLILLDLNQHDLALKISYKLLEIDPINSIRFFNISAIFKQQNKNKKAKEYIISAIKLDPSIGNYWLTLGVIESSFGHIYHAIELFKKAILSDTKEKSFNETWGYNNIANAYIKIGESKLAYEYYEKSIKASLSFGTRVQEGIKQNYLCNLSYLSENVEEIYIKHRELRKIYDNEPKYNFLEIQKSIVNEKIRIGYVSPDFRKHSISFFFNKLLDNHDKEKFEIFLYSNLEGKEDHITKSFKSMACHWRDINDKSDHEVVNIINNDGINILVDLAGNFSGGRTGLFSLKPAPIQVSYLGYVMTTGLKSIDYRFTTQHADPYKKDEKFYTEKLIRLPNTFLCYTGVDVYNVQNPPCSLGKPLTFASFNNISKISDKTIRIWSKLLNNFDKSILLIKSSVPADNMVYQKFEEKFQKNGISQGRIKYMNKTNSMIDHLKLYNMVDIALDTFPFNGATTTFEALWMGVPVMTIKGDIHYSRVSTSILTALGMDYCVGKNEDDFLNKTINLSNNIDKLINLRKELRNKIKSSPLYDGETFAKNVEKEYKKMLLDLK